MDLSLYQQIRQLPEYKRILSSDHIDATNSNKIKLGSLEFVTLDKGHRFTVTGKTGNICREGATYTPRPPYAITGYIGKSIGKIGLLTTLDDYREALKVILVDINNREFKIWGKINKDHHKAIRMLFVRNCISIEMLNSNLR